MEFMRLNRFTQRSELSQFKPISLIFILEVALQKIELIKLNRITQNVGLT
ncbi:hypothetical protein Godav_011662 [Gossypium davidsonii]|uniref:Uncharacterized protein n=1 Tax=Gossypium davidsonii TaxID=34287 RepID=A0A7J8RBI9_GOSDV|nr:hypothetical protein [Gossypium davidsonii]